MSTWSHTELSAIGDADELRVTSYRSDGTLRPFVTIWGVRAGDDIYVRSAHGPGNGWFSRARTVGTGRIRAGGIETDVTFDAEITDTPTSIDAAYHAKYDRYGPGPVGAVTGPAAVDVTLRVRPRR
ncbi:DUF2255 family protein [Cellulomonas sp. McL0617]|uniref:DUF2255 family protein n=1 Tax=Cellulomonas sp. McL0617 TaxID=3415675 RepID=UPI003CE751E6